MSINKDISKISLLGKCSICKKKNILHLSVTWADDKSFDVNGFESMFNCDYTCGELRKEHGIKPEFGMKTAIAKSILK